MSTTPFWHNYTGPRQKHEGFDYWPTTAQDAISRLHDKGWGGEYNGAQLFKKNLSTEERLNTISLDATYIGLTYLLQNTPLVSQLYNRASAFSDASFLFNLTPVGWATGMSKSLFYDATDKIVGDLAKPLFTANIAYQTTQLIGSALGANEKQRDIAASAAAGATVCGALCAVGAGVGAWLGWW